MPTGSALRQSACRTVSPIAPTDVPVFPPAQGLFDVPGLLGHIPRQGRVEAVA